MKAITGEAIRSIASPDHKHDIRKNSRIARVYCRHNNMKRAADFRRPGVTIPSEAARRSARRCDAIVYRGWKAPATTTVPSDPAMKAHSSYPVLFCFPRDEAKSFPDGNIGTTSTSLSQPTRAAGKYHDCPVRRNKSATQQAIDKC